MSPLIIGAVMAAAVAVLLYGIRTGARRVEVAAKAIASASFVLLGALRWSAGDPVDGWLLAGLVLCAAGDLLLLSERTFDLGLAAFLAGHVSYVIGFGVAAPASSWPLAPLALFAVAALVVAAWLWPRLGRRRVPVAAYIVAITAMVWAAIACSMTSRLPWTAAAGAFLFYLSDLAVARHRFVKAEFLNRALGLPTYYAGQLLIALVI